MLTSFVVIGSLMERGTEPNAASCKTYSISSTAFRQSSIFRISPTCKLKVCGYCSNKGKIFPGFPVEKLSKQRTICPSIKRYSQRLEPIKPAPPVTRTFILFQFSINHLSNTSYSEFLLLNSGTIPFIIWTVPILSTLIAKAISGLITEQISL